jgi:hypothetical protein
MASQHVYRVRSLANILAELAKFASHVQKLSTFLSTASQA